MEHDDFNLDSGQHFLINVKVRDSNRLYSMII